MIKFLNDTFKTYIIQYYIGHTYNPKYYVHARLFTQIVLNNSTQYPNRQSFHEAMETLYGVVFNGFYNVVGKTSLFKFEIKGLHGQFVSHDDLMQESVRLCMDALLHPHFEQNIFDEEVYSMITQLHAVKENKRGYASYRFKHTLDPLHTVGMSLEEQLLVLKSIKLKDVIKYYNTFVKDASRIAVGTGPFNPNDIIFLHHTFESNQKTNIQLSYDPIAFKTLDTLKEFVDMNQKMIYQAYHVGIHPQDTLYYAVLLYNEILGSSADSRLFREVREKRGLCYQVYAGYNPFDTTLTIYAGIDIDKEDETLKALKEVIESMEVMTDNEILFAKKSLIHQVTSILDQQTYGLDAITREHFYSYHIDHQTRISRIEAVSHKTLKDVHEKVKYMYTYMLTGEKHD